MSRTRPAFVVALALLSVAPALRGQQPLPLPPAPASVTLSPEEMDVFLRTAKITKKANINKGVTDTIRVTLSDGRITHDAQIQDVDIEKTVFEAGKASETNFKDTYRYNIGGYRLARLLGMTNVPMSVKRVVDNKDAAVTWWIDDVQFDEQGRLKQTPRQGPDPERTVKQIASRLVFDELIQNRDRNQGNLLWTKDWTLWLIDHTRAFRLGKTLVKPDQLSRCDRALLAALRTLTFEAMDKAMGDVMRDDEMKAVLVRRDLLVKHFEDRVALLGEAIVLFTM
jgi:hypothetical protein